MSLQRSASRFQLVFLQNPTPLITISVLMGRTVATFSRYADKILKLDLI
jgi:hypothetical protein